MSRYDPVFHLEATLPKAHVKIDVVGLGHTFVLDEFQVDIPPGDYTREALYALIDAQWQVLREAYALTKESQKREYITYPI